MGPPMVPPKSFQRSAGALAWQVDVKLVLQLFSGLALSMVLTLLALLEKLLAANASLRMNS